MLHEYKHGGELTFTVTLADDPEIVSFEHAQRMRLPLWSFPPAVEGSKL
jgi:hypothetical protein